MQTLSLTGASAIIIHINPDSDTIKQLKLSLSLSLLSELLFSFFVLLQLLPAVFENKALDLVMHYITFKGPVDMQLVFEALKVRE